MVEDIQKGGEEAKERLAKSIRENELGQAYFEDEVVRSAAPGEDVWPTALYVDGFEFGASDDSAIGLWLHNLVLDSRILLAVLKANELCGCGCRGWCSSWAIWNMIAWSVGWLRRGRNPRRRECDWG